MEALDYSKASDDADSAAVPDHLVDRDALARLRDAGRDATYDVPNYDDNADNADEANDDEDEDGQSIADSKSAASAPSSRASSTAGTPVKAPARTSVLSFFQNLTGQKVCLHSV